MADKKEAEETSSRGNEWEVVSLTASAYAAAPGPEQVDDDEVDNKDTSVGKDESETFHAMFMSGHFVFPPSQHENLPLDPKNNEICKGEEPKAAFLGIADEGSISNAKAEENWKLQGLNVSEDYPEILFDEKGNQLSITGTEFEEDMAFHCLSSVEKMPNMHGSASFNSSDSEATLTGSTIITSRSISGQNEQSDLDLDLDGSDMPKDKVEYTHNGASLPCEAWWKRRVTSLYAHAKEANAFWSIFIAATVMGFVILGHRWQQERWKVLQRNWEIGIKDAGMGRMLGPIYRFKHVIVGGGQKVALSVAAPQ